MLARPRSQRAQWVSRMIAQNGQYGLVTPLSRESGAARQTLYRWAAHGQQALEAAFAPPVAGPGLPADVPRQVLTLLVETHPGERGIQVALRALTRRAVSLGTIGAILREAGERALAWLATHAPPGVRPLALDEIYGNDRRGAYLGVVDAAGYAVWAAAGPLAVDAETWTLVLWQAQERGLRWAATSSDGGGAISSALRVVDPDGRHGRDVWHVLHGCSQAQGRLDRWAAQLERRTATVGRQAARVAAGKRPLGRRPRTDPAAQAAAVAQAQGVADGVRYLTDVLHDLLEVVVVTPRGLLDAAGRERDLDALLEPPAEVQRLHRHLRGARAGLLAWVGPLEAVQRAAALRLGADGLALVAWAWQRRALLGPATDDLLAQLPAAWRPAARALVTAWERALRASSAAENWHSLLRPHPAAHRVLSPGLLALLAVWHNHRIFTRGAHAGSSPLQLSGLPDAPTDWLVALGYPPAEPAVSPPAAPQHVPIPLPRAA